jgi:rfaE bifunctional protein kinase chain/domain
MIEAFDGKEVLVIGDVILDEYIFGDVERISPEAPVPVLRQTKRELRLGGAANVAANCASLGASSYLFSIVGIDDEAEEIEELCKKFNINTCLRENINKQTPLKTRFVCNRQQILRVDKEGPSSDNDKVWKKNCKKYIYPELLGCIKQVDLVIVSDYNKGCINSELMRLLKNNSKFVVVDPKPENIEMYKGVNLVTPNKKEAIDILGIKKTSLNKNDLIRLSSIFESDVLVTLGEEGMIYYTKGKEPIYFPAVAQEVYDVTGAGDTVISIVGLGISLGMDIKEVCELSNKAAAQVIEKFGTTIVEKGRLQWSNSRKE